MRTGIVDELKKQLTGWGIWIESVEIT